MNLFISHILLSRCYGTGYHQWLKRDFVVRNFRGVLDEAVQVLHLRICIYHAAGVYQVACSM